MNEENLKSLLIRDKQFLKSLFETSNVFKNKHLVNTADDAHLDTLIKYLHFVTNGKIFINRQNFEVIRKTKKIKILQKFVESENSTLMLLNGTRRQKVQFLLKLTSVYVNLFYGLFNLENF